MDSILPLITGPVGSQWAPKTPGLEVANRLYQGLAELAKVPPASKPTGHTSPCTDHSQERELRISQRQCSTPDCAARKETHQLVGTLAKAWALNALKPTAASWLYLHLSGQTSPNLVPGSPSVPQRGEYCRHMRCVRQDTAPHGRTRSQLWLLQLGSFLECSVFVHLVGASPVWVSREGPRGVWFKDTWILYLRILRVFRGHFTQLSSLPTSSHIPLPWACAFPFLKSLFYYKT